MTEKDTSFDWSTYRPQRIEDVLFVPSTLASRIFEPGQVANFQPQLTPQGHILINIAHQNYPDAVCQIQMFFNAEERGYDVFFFHGSPSENYIPDEEAERIAKSAIPYTLDQIDAMFNSKVLQ